jgi:hypothetical protein
VTTEVKMMMVNKMKTKKLLEKQAKIHTFRVFQAGLSVLVNNPSATHEEIRTAIDKATS